MGRKNSEHISAIKVKQSVRRLNQIFDCMRHGGDPLEKVENQEKSKEIGEHSERVVMEVLREQQGVVFVRKSTEEEDINKWYDLVVGSRDEFNYTDRFKVQVKSCFARKQEFLNRKKRELKLTTLTETERRLAELGWAVIDAGRRADGSYDREAIAAQYGNFLSLRRSVFSRKS